LACDAAGHTLVVCVAEEAFLWLVADDRRWPGVDQALTLAHLRAPPTDTLLDILTVEEMLLYTAELKRPLTEPLESKKSAVEDLLDVSSHSPCNDLICDCHLW
jgi:hypothetical protein